MNIFPSVLLDVDDFGHMMSWWWGIPYISFWGILFWIVQIIIAVLVYKDAQKRKQNGLLWLVLIILPWVGILFLIIYLIIRREETDLNESIDESLNTLDERYAKGEITREEYFQIQKDLTKMRRER